MLSESDYQEAVRHYKNIRVNGHERQRCHALMLVHQGYSYREAAQILLVDEETISRWARQYQERGLAGLQNAPGWGGEHGQRELSAEEFYCGVVPQEWLETYKGVIWLNRRSPAGANLSTVADLKRLVEKSHQARVPVFITLNAPIYTSRQIPYLVELGKRLEGEVGVDALIVSDVGLIMALRSRPQAEGIGSRAV